MPEAALQALSELGVGLPDAPVLIDRACLETGLSDFGDDSLRARLVQVVELIRGTGMPLAGEHAAAQVIHHLLTSRLRFFDDRKHFPLDAEEIVRPVFATGEPRSGTTLLHALLASDPSARTLRFWEVMYPSPPPGISAPDDPRRRQAAQDWREILALIPKWLVSHPYNDMLGEGLPECERTWAFDFRVMTPTAWWRVPMKINTAGLPADQLAQYRLHKMILQHCQHGRPARRWALKGFHGLRLRALFETYPDASVVWVHREPLEVAASRVVLLGQIMEAITGRLDWPSFAREQIAATRATLDSVMVEPMVNDSRVHHVRYPDFVADPVGAIRKFYECQGIQFDDSTAQAMHDYLAHNRSDRYGRFEYSLDVIGEDIAALNDAFEPYRQRFLS